MRLHVTEAIAGFTPVDLAALRADAEARFDVYIQERSQLVLYQSSNHKTQADWAARLDRGDVHTVYVPDAQRVLLSRYLEEHVESILSDDGVSTAAKGAPR